MKSLNQIIAELETFASVHYQIHTFGHGDVWEATPNSSEIVYPILWLVPNGATTGVNEVTTNFTVLCMDLVRSGEENETEVLSDTLQIILDVVSYYRQQHNQTYIVEFGSNIQPFTESHPDMLAGHSITVSIRQPFKYDECAIPFSGAPTPIVPTCAAATIQNAASNPTYQASIASGDNLILPQVKVLDSDGVTEITANYIPESDGYVAECSVPTCADATVTNQAEDYSLSIASGATEKLPFGKVKDSDGGDVQVDYIPAADGYIFEATACAAQPSISLVLSDSTPHYQQEITLTATASNLSGTLTYTFYAVNQYGESATMYTGSSNTVDWQFSLVGTVEVKCEVTNGTDTLTDCVEVTIAGFITEWNTLASGTSLDFDEINVLFDSSSTSVARVVNWINEDGTLDGTETITNYNDAAWTHTFASEGKKYVQILDADGLVLNTRRQINVLNKIKGIYQWGSAVLYSGFGEQFWPTTGSYRIDINISANDALTFPSNARCDRMFVSSTCTVNTRGWNMSSVVNVDRFFQGTAVRVTDWSFMKTLTTVAQIDWPNNRVIDKHWRFIDWSIITDATIDFQGTTALPDYEQMLINAADALPITPTAINARDSVYRSGSSAATARAAIVTAGITITDGGAI